MDFIIQHTHIYNIPSESNRIHFHLNVEIEQHATEQPMGQWRKDKLKIPETNKNGNATLQNL